MLFYFAVVIILTVEGGRALTSQNSTVYCFVARDEQTHMTRVCGARASEATLCTPFCNMFQIIRRKNGGCSCRRLRRSLPDFN